MSHLDGINALGAGLLVGMNGDTTTGTYTPITGSALTAEPAIEQNLEINGRRGTMDVMIESASLSAPQINAKWTASDSRVWNVVGWETVPGWTVLKVETSFGTGADT